MTRLAVLLALLLIWATTPADLCAGDGAGMWEFPPRPRLAVRGEALVLVDGGRTTVLLPAVPPSEAAGGAAVRCTRELVSSRNGRRAVALLTIGRQSVALPIRREGGGAYEFARPIPVPRATGVFLSPQDDAFLLVSERDLTRPPDADRPGWNRAAVYLRFGNLAWSRQLDVSPDTEADHWYEQSATGARYAAAGKFVLRAIRWMEDGCLLHADVAGNGPRSIRLRPRHEWTAARARLPEVGRLLGTRKADLWPVGGGRFLALADDGPHAAEVVLLTADPSPRILDAVRADEHVEDLLCPAFVGELDFDEDGAPEVLFYDWTGIQGHKNVWLVRVADDGLAIVTGSLFCDRVPGIRYEPESGEDRIELVRNWWSALGRDGGEVFTSLAWRKGALTPVAEEHRITAESVASFLETVAYPPDVCLRVLASLAGRSFADLEAARDWWADHAERFRRGNVCVFPSD